MSNCKLCGLRRVVNRLFFCRECWRSIPAAGRRHRALGGGPMTSIVCPASPQHGPMVRRTNLTPEQAWCGEWWDCRSGCHSSVLIQSPALIAFHQEMRCQHDAGFHSTTFLRGDRKVRAIGRWTSYAGQCVNCGASVEVVA
jgi:hypothetical protein